MGICCSRGETTRMTFLCEPPHYIRRGANPVRNFGEDIGATPGPNGRVTLNPNLLMGYDLPCVSDPPPSRRLKLLRRKNPAVRQCEAAGPEQRRGHYKGGSYPSGFAVSMAFSKNLRWFAQTAWTP